MHNAKSFVGRWLAAAVPFETYKLVVCPLSRSATVPPEWEPNESFASLLDNPYSLIHLLRPKQDIYPIFGLVNFSRQKNLIFIYILHKA